MKRRSNLFTMNLKILSKNKLKNTEAFSIKVSLKMTKMINTAWRFTLHSTIIYSCYQDKKIKKEMKN